MEQEALSRKERKRLEQKQRRVVKAEQAKRAKSSAGPQMDVDASTAFGATIQAHRQAGGMAVISTHTDLGLSDVRHLNLSPS